ncbi:MAG: DEAD/DEAH box helicase [Anaerolineae bacterium]|nr:DEAD/DEAH box helicase [Anaerolineae bacterium]
MNFQIGQLITAPFLPGIAEVKGFSQRTGYARLEVVLQDGSNQFISRNLTPEQLALIQIVQQNRLARYADSADFFLYIEAHRLRLAYQFDPQLAVSISQVDPLPHQIEAVYHYVLPSPRIRFLIADDPGAGKTIMAGLIIKELQYRRLAQRILIVAPGHLKYQWQREMKERFQTPFAIIDRARLDSTWGENAWEERDHCITSIDFVKQDNVRNTLRGIQWDLVIVDEAHKMSAYAYQSRERVKVDKTKRYQVGETLSRNSHHLLFLTATPHRGDEENFRLFLDLLRPGFFAQTELLRESVENKDNPVFVRRLKEDMKRFDGSAIFPPRHVHTVRFRLTPAEQELYNNVTRYVQNYFDRAKENRSITFALMILQRRLTSSTHAIYRSLGRRKERLETLLTLPDRIRQDEDYVRARGLTEDDFAEMSEDERMAWEERLENLTLAANIEDVQAEIEQLERLIDQAEAVRRQEIESKLVKLRDSVLSNLGERKLLIFTEFRDTVNYLVEKLQAWNYKVITIHGQMNMDDRIAAEHEFKENAQIMVATEAAGEGINLQFCSWMINYDIPWNPNRLEQRMGRIHRYGQQYEVHIYNMITQDTREGQILDRIFEKLETMKNALGSDRVFDIIGDMIPGSRLDELLKEAIFSQRRMEEIEQTIDAVNVTEAQQTLERAFMTSLATRHIDYSGLRQEKLTAEENRLVPEYVQDYFLRAYPRLGGTMDTRQTEDGFYAIQNVPYELRRWNDDYRFKTAYGTLHRHYRQVTFDKAVARDEARAEFVAPGHPLLEAVNEEILSRFGQRDAFALFGDPEGQRQGVLWFVEGEVTDGSGTAAGKRVFCLYQPLQGEIQTINAAVLWDIDPLTWDKLESYPAKEQLERLLRQRDAIEDHIVTEVLFPFQAEIAERRGHETRVKEKYGLRSLDYLMQESNQKILDYEMRQMAGENVDLPLLNEQRNLEELRRKREGLEQEILLERNLTVGDPRILGAALVMPLVGEGAKTEPVVYQISPQAEPEVKEREETDYMADSGVDAERKQEIELVGMRMAMAYETANGWLAEDVSGENHGFDLRSTLYGADGAFADIRYIEVKARVQSGAIRLSSNEWKKARRYEESYWLYVVTYAGTNEPQLQRIQNPAGHFQMEEDIFATGYIIPESNWKEKINQIQE